MPLSLSSGQCLSTLADVSAIDLKKSLLLIRLRPQTGRGAVGIVIIAYTESDVDWESFWPPQLGLKLGKS